MLQSVRNLNMVVSDFLNFRSITSQTGTHGTRILTHGQGLAASENNRPAFPYITGKLEIRHNRGDQTMPKFEASQLLGEVSNVNSVCRNVHE